MEAHKQPAAESMQRVDQLVNTPLSNVDAVEFLEKLEHEKTCAAPVDADVKDARRRINATRGPAKRKNKRIEQPEDSDDDGDSN